MIEKSGVEVWKALKDDIEVQIITGVYKGGDKLPSVVELMNMYNVSRGTVQKALKALNEEETVISRGTKGVFVMPFVRELLLRKHRDELRKRYSDIVDEAMRIGLPIDEVCVNNH